MGLLETSLYGNSVRLWLIALGTAGLTLLAFKLLVRLVTGRLTRHAERTSSNWDIVLASLNGTKSFLLLIVALYVGAGGTLDLPSGTFLLLRQLTILAILAQAGIWASAGIGRWVSVQRERGVAEGASAAMTMNVVGLAVRILVWSIVLLVALDNIGIDVTALVAGLGIGGIAVALAAQNILGDLFASLAIVMDKPFNPGDFLVVDDFKGKVEEIGLKTTRMRSLSGEQLVFSNTDLLNSRIRNYGRMLERRVVFTIGVTYETPRAKLEVIPRILRETVEARDNVRFDRSHFRAYGDYAIVFETVYFVLSQEYSIHMDVQQDINLGIHERFEAEEIEFAYPTQTVHLVNREG